MKELLDAIQSALKSQNWYAAIFLALALPDICGKLENPESMKSEERYKTWFNKYLSKIYCNHVGADQTEHVFLTGEDLFALRCACLHEGSDEISDQRCQLVLNKFKFTV